MKKEHCVYRYVDSMERVLYVGKTNSSLKARITAHRYEERFSLPESFRVEYIELENSVETDAVEKFFINKYRPPLNIKDKLDGPCCSLEIQNAKWVPYSEYCKENRTPRQIKKDVDEYTSKYRFLCAATESNGAPFFACGPYTQSLLPIGGELVNVANSLSASANVYVVGGEMLKILKESFCEIAFAIALPIINSSAACEDAEFLQIAKAVDFLDEVQKFSKEGFENEASLWRFNFAFENPGEQVLTFCRPLFSPEIFISGRECRADVDYVGYEETYRFLRESLCAKTVRFAVGKKLLPKENGGF